jgi:hypothetical protein
MSQKIAILRIDKSSGALRAKAVYRVIGIFIGGAATIATDGRRRS